MPESHDELIRILNEAISLEYTAVVQYNQSSMLLSGRDRAVFEDFFKDNAKEALSHAKRWGDRIVYLGGVPKAELRPIRQSTNLMELLQIGLETEQKAVELYTRAHSVCKHEPTKYMLEEHIADEDEDVEEFMKYLSKTRIAEGSGGERQAANAGR